MRELICDVVEFLSVLLNDLGLEFYIFTLSKKKIRENINANLVKFTSFVARNIGNLGEWIGLQMYKTRRPKVSYWVYNVSWMVG
jgi:hypothetical protein